MKWGVMQGHAGRCFAYRHWPETLAFVRSLPLRSRSILLPSATVGKPTFTIDTANHSCYATTALL